MHFQSSEADETERGFSLKNQRNHLSQIQKVKQQRKKLRKQIFGDHYNYNYRRPNKNNLYRAQQFRNLEIQRQNRILLEKIQSIFKKKNHQQNKYSSNHTELAETPKHYHVQRYRDSHKMDLFESPMNKNMVRLEKIKTEHHNQSHQQIRNSYKKVNKEKNFKTEDLKQSNHKQSHIKYPKRRHRTEANETNMKTISEREQPQNLLTNQKNHQLTEMQRQNNQGSKIILFHGHKHISSALFDIRIYIQSQVYFVEAEMSQKMEDKFKQILKLPYSQYRKIYTKYLEQDHMKIFEYLWVSKLSGLLQFVGLEKKMMEQIQYQTKQIFDSPKTSHEKSPKNPERQQQKKQEKIEEKQMLEDPIGLNQIDYQFQALESEVKEEEQNKNQQNEITKKNQENEDTHSHKSQQSQNNNGDKSHRSQNQEKKQQTKPIESSQQPIKNLEIHEKNQSVQVQKQQ